MSTRTVVIPHVGRIEGHGGITIVLDGDRVSDINLDVHEGSRYYEALLKGKHYLQVQGIITRVCAICSSHHTVAALMAIEDALSIPQTARTKALRALLILGGTIESHALHVFALTLPDFLGFDSVVSMAERHPHEVTFALKLKQLGNRLQQLIGGRPIHPVNTLVGGFGQIPSQRQISAIRDDLCAAVEPLFDLLAVMKGISVPQWAEQPAVYMALRPSEEAYRFQGTDIVTSNGGAFAIHDYREVVREFVVQHSHAKHAAVVGEPYIVGALARLELFGHLLQGRAREAFEELFPEGLTDNILLNTNAQLVELVHCLQRAIELCAQLLDQPEGAREVLEHEVRAGRGVGALEVPRGTLFHEYELDAEGLVVEANVITPTAQNLANIELDLAATAERLLAETAADDRALRLNLEMVVRAYDPCISCSVHVLR